MTAATAEPRRRSRRKRRSVLWHIGHAVVGWIARSRRVRRTGVLVGVGAAFCTALVIGLAVIMLNNVVIKRNAELGKLKSQRSKLTEQNALDSAQTAQLSAPTRIVRIATTQLGMVETPVMQQFIYLHPHKAADAQLQLRPTLATDYVTAAPAVKPATKPKKTTAKTRAAR